MDGRKRRSWEEWWMGTRRLSQSANPQTTTKPRKRKNDQKKEDTEPDIRSKKVKASLEKTRKPATITRKRKEVQKQNGAKDGMRQLTVLQMISRIESGSMDDSTGKDEQEVDVVKVGLEKKMMDGSKPESDLKLGVKTKIFRRGGPDLKEGNILQNKMFGTKKTKTTYRDENVFHVPLDDDESSDGFPRNGKKESEKKPSIATARDVSSNQ